MKFFSCIWCNKIEAGTEYSHHKRTQGPCESLVGKVICHQDWRPEFDHQVPHGRRKDVIYPMSCSQTPTSTQWHLWVKCMCVSKHTAQKCIQAYVSHCVHVGVRDNFQFLLFNCWAVWSRVLHCFSVYSRQAVLRASGSPVSIAHFAEGVLELPILTMHAGVLKIVLWEFHNMHKIHTDSVYHHSLGYTLNSPPKIISSLIFILIAKWHHGVKCDQLMRNYIPNENILAFL